MACQAHSICCPIPFYCREEYNCRFSGEKWDAPTLDACLGLAHTDEERTACWLTDLAECLDDITSDCDESADCSGMPDDEDALTCFLALIDCRAGECDRTFTDCCVSIAKDYVQCLYDQYVAFNTCKDSAAEPSCDTDCTDERDVCYTDCMGDPDCEADCDAAFDLCTAKCLYAYYSRVNTCYGSYLVCNYSFSDCAKTESDRTDDDAGVDGRWTELCFAGMFDCRSGVMDDYNSAFETIRTGFITCLSPCYSGLAADPETFDFTSCRASCEKTFNTSLDVADTNRIDNYRNCCEAHETTGSASTYDTAAMLCQENYRDCDLGRRNGIIDCSTYKSNCIDACDPGDTDCTDACNADYVTCLTSVDCDTAKAACIANCMGDVECLDECDTARDACATPVCEDVRNDCMDAIDPTTKPCIQCWDNFSDPSDDFADQCGRLLPATAASRFDVGSLPL